MDAYDVVIVGGGIVGASAAYHLSRAGHKVLLLDQFGVPNEFASSCDHVQEFRLTFGKDLFYTELAVQSLALWKEFQQDIHEELYTCTGMLDLAVREGGYEEHCHRALTSMNLPVRKLGPAELRERFRIFNHRAVRYAVFHPDGGMLWAQRSVAAFANAALRRRTTIHKNVRIISIARGKDGVREVRDSQGRTYRGGAYLFAPGPWAREVLAPWRLPLHVTRQPLLYFRPPTNQGRYRPGHCPVYFCRDRGYFGYPVHIHGFMKIGDRRRGLPGKPGQGPTAPPQGFERACRSFLRRFMPDAAAFVDTEGKFTYYNNTPDGDFIIDHLPGAQNAVAATGLAGHGFKFGPLVGRVASELLLAGKTNLNITRFRIARFKRR